ncbi:aspartate--tRNA ligase [Acholeplasma hippikon]|nr:aspartate--tRNA ligase [Acholeplasma hippikon]
MFKYTHNNNELTLKNLGEKVALKGWVNKKRNLGGLIFIDLRDKFGITQLLVKPESSFYQIASEIKSEYVIEVEGVVIERESKNKNILTGEIEVEVSNLVIINTANPTPITISDDQNNISEEVRLKYRYLDLRRPASQKYLLERSKITQAIRSALLDLGFPELETPYMVKSTPEGAKEFLVPSRLYHGEVYALAQSPQQFKQLYMIAGFEKYFQVARCFRDEDLRADRQLEFTQIDIEASFVEQEDILNVGEKVLSNIFKAMGKELVLPLQRMPYAEAFDKYGSDKPDLRYELFIENFNELFVGHDVPVFKGKEVIRGFKVSNNAIFTRKYFDRATEIVKQNHGDALAYLKKENGVVSGSIAKFVEGIELQDGFTYFFVTGTYEDATNACGALRKELAKDLNMIDPNKEALLWVVDFPLLEYRKEEDRFYARHHPFTAPQSVEELRNNPATCLAKAYDAVWNGYEIGGGSIRIHNQQVQQLMFDKLGFTEEKLTGKFGFFLEALSYGTPPHGGIAFGLDRITMLATKTDNIKDVVAFPKTQSARDLMTQAPSPADEKQFIELGIKVR